MNQIVSSFKEKWVLWLLPILALIFSGYFLYRYYHERGLDIVVSFTEAKSIQPEKTKVFYRGVPVGMVRSINLSKDGKKAECHIELEKNANQFAVEGSAFYLVYPKVGFEGISGLETIVSGSYIEVDPGNKDNEKRLEFDGGLSKKIGPQENTTSFILETDHAESITPGDNVYFKGLVIGSVGETKLSPTGQSVIIEINIQNKYLRLIRTNTVFWKKQGIKADLGLFKSDIRINSLDTILKGGLEIATPNQAGPIAPRNQRYWLLRDEPKEKDKEKWNPILTLPEKASKIKKGKK